MRNVTAIRYLGAVDMKIYNFVAYVARSGFWGFSFKSCLGFTVISFALVILFKKIPDSNKSVYVYSVVLFFANV